MIDFIEKTLYLEFKIHIISSIFIIMLFWSRVIEFTTLKIYLLSPIFIITWFMEPHD